MTFVDTNVFMYAVGRPHPLREQARSLFLEAAREGRPRRLCTSAEVLQELVHAYLPVGRHETLRAALTLALERCDDIWSLEPEDVELAVAIASERPGLSARDLCHLACCRRRGVRSVVTFDRPLAAAFGR